MYRLVKINELPEALTSGPGEYTAIDVPDVLSPTGYTTYKILTTLLQGAISQNLEDTLQIGSGTGSNRLQISEAINPLSFLDLPNLTRLSLIQQSMAQDLDVYLPSESGTLALEYDSGIKTLPVYNGVYGLADLGNVALRPTVRVIGRTVKLEGILLLPMPTASGGAILDTNGAGYTLATQNYGDLFTGAGTGYEIDAKNNAISWAPILPSALRPTETIRFLSSTALGRTLNIPGGRIRITNWVDVGAILTDGRLYFRGIEASERNGDTGTGWNKNQHARKIVDRFELNDSLLNYDNYYNSFDNAGVVDKQVQNLQGYKYTFNFDGTRVNDLGGFVPTFNVSYNLDANLTLNQIKTAFDSL